jgi:dCTP deaminase
MNVKQGAIPFQMIREMIRAGYIPGAAAENIQPSSLDLTVTDEIYRMRGSYLPRAGESVRELVEVGALYKSSLEYPLDRGGIYLIRLNESLRLPKMITAVTTNKSSTGRIDLRTRLVADGITRFDTIPAGHRGSLWIEVAPKSFPVKLYPGMTLNQMRFFFGPAKLNALEHGFAYDNHGLLRDAFGRPIPQSDNRVGEGITMTIDLVGDEGAEDDAIIGWRSLPGASNVLDMKRFDHDPFEFFEPLRKQPKGQLTLTTGVFYILNTKERIVVPPEFAMQMANYDPSVGEFRAHFAGFFDPGFGWNEEDAKRGTTAVLEVEAYGHECVLRDGQPICLMVYERMLAVPEKIYGENVGSHYVGQTGPRLSKWFRAIESRLTEANTRQPAPSDSSAPQNADQKTEESSFTQTVRAWDDDRRFDLG